LKVIYLVDDDD